MNLGLSPSFCAPHNADFSTPTYPALMLVDYVRVYQSSNAHNIGSDPPDRPTKAYIDAYPGAYTIPNFTLCGSGQFNQPQPKNRLLGPKRSVPIPSTYHNTVS